jgi:GNAT superfamily N-acetyltransferase
VFRRGDSRDFPGIARLFETVYGKARTIASLQWLYEDNPAGRCRLWLAEDRAHGEIVGLRPVFPWRVRVDGTTLLVAQAGDAMTHPRMRGRGIFSQLVATTWAELKQEGVPFAFSFPNRGSTAVYRKLAADGHAATHEVLSFQRMVFPLSLRLLGDRLPALSALAGTGDRLFRPVLHRRWRPSRRLVPFSIERFGPEADRLWHQAADAYSVVAVRDRAYLNWRFFDAPSGRFQVIGLRAEGEFAGYIAFEIGQGDAAIADLFCLPDRQMIAALLAAALRRILERRAMKVSIWSAGARPFDAVIRRFGFVPRDDRLPMAVNVFRSGRSTQSVTTGSRWLAWLADRDIERLSSDTYSAQSHLQDAAVSS